MSSAMSHARYRWNTGSAARDARDLGGAERRVFRRPRAEAPCRGGLQRCAVWLRARGETNARGSLPVRRAFGARRGASRGPDERTTRASTFRSATRFEASDARVSARPSVVTDTRGGPRDVRWRAPKKAFSSGASEKTRTVRVASREWRARAGWSPEAPGGCYRARCPSRRRRLARGGRRERRGARLRPARPPR